MRTQAEKEVERMKRISIGLVLPFLMLGLVLMGLMAFSSAPARATNAVMAPSDLGDPVTIVFWHNHGGDRGEFMQQMIDEFNAANPYSIAVQGEYAGSYGEIYNKVIQGLHGAGPLPNAVVGYPNQFADYARYGGVRFLDGYIEDPVLGITDTEDFYPGLLDYYRLDQYGDQLAGLQHGRSIELMYYNADLLAAAGITIPTTWDAFETACISLTTESVSGTIPSGDTSCFANWLWSRGGEVLSDDSRHARFHEQPGIESLLLFQELMSGGYAHPVYEPNGDQSAFCNGETGFTFGSSAVIPYYRYGMEQGADDAWGVTRVPAVPGNEAVDAYGAGVGVLQSSEDEDRAAWLLIRWLAEREQTARWATLSGYFPVRISATTHPSMTQKLADDAQYAQAYELLSLTRNEPQVRGYEQIRGIIGGAIGEIFYDSANVTATLEAAALEVDALLDGSGPASAIIPPSGGTLVYTNTEGLDVMLEFPTGAIGVTQTVSYVPLDDLPTDGLAFALVPNLSFSQPVTITIHYRDSDVEGMDEAELKLYLYDWSSNRWVEGEPCGGYLRDPPNNILQAVVCHFSDYALVDRPYAIYLPVLLKNS
jgi:ABC-type glycerol-3-phosphate transport system substrate-binding protein